MAQRNVSIVAHTRHRSSSRLLLLCSNFHNDVPLASQRNVSMAAERGAVRPSIAQPDCFCCVSILITTPPRVSAERIHGRSMAAVRPSMPQHRCGSQNTNTGACYAKRNNPFCNIIAHSLEPHPRKNDTCAEKNQPSLF